MPVVIAGAGGHAKVICDTLLASGLPAYEIIGLLDDNPQKHGFPVMGYPVVGSLDTFQPAPGTTLALGIGDNAARAQVGSRAKALGYPLINVVHPSAWIGRHAVLGQGVAIFAQAVVNAEARIGNGVILNTACSVDHECIVEDYAHVAPGARLAGSVRLGPGVLVGVGAIIVPGLSIGANAIVGAGAVVIHDLPPGCVAVGNPARIIKSV